MVNKLIQSKIETPLGDMIAIADDTHLHLLEFDDRKNIEAQLQKIGDVQTGHNKIIESIRDELKNYFTGNLQAFKTPLKLYGSDFQQSVMKTLINVPYGEIRAYKNQADTLNKPTAVRAVANANGRNQIAIAIPCHRVIGSDGSLTGYAGGLERKEWLLNHERKYA
jgi:AraC family transcriptional regulator of adaptative response/methylated-DNA-[protein]-cysteine methyltransferase